MTRDKEGKAEERGKRWGICIRQVAIQVERRIEFFFKYISQLDSIEKTLKYTSIRYCRFRKKYNSVLCIAGKKLNFLRRV